MSGLRFQDQKLLEITALLQRFEPPGSPPQEGWTSVDIGAVGLLATVDD